MVLTAEVGCYLTEDCSIDPPVSINLRVAKLVPVCFYSDQRTMLQMAAERANQEEESSARKLQE